MTRWILIIIVFSYNSWRLILNINVVVTDLKNNLFDVIYVCFPIFVMIQQFNFIFVKRSELRSLFIETLKCCRRKKSLREVRWMSRCLTLMWFMSFVQGFGSVLMVTFYYGYKNALLSIARVTTAGSFSLLDHLHLWVVNVCFTLFVHSYFPFVSSVTILGMFCNSLIQKDFIEFMTRHLNWSQQRIRDDRKYWIRMIRMDKSFMSLFNLSLLFWISYIFAAFCLTNSTLKTTLYGEKDPLVLMIDQFGTIVIQVVYFLAIIYSNHELNSSVEDSFKKFRMETLDSNSPKINQLSSTEMQQFLKQMEQTMSRRITVYSVFDLNTGFIFALVNALVPLAVLISQLMVDPC